jgi:hypothetical protein
MKIKNENDLVQLLKIYASESVRKAKNSLSESADPAQRNYLKGLKASENHFDVTLDEQEESNPEETDEKEETDEENAESSEEEKVPDAEKFGTSFEGVVKYINNLRAGRSTKDKEIKDELISYYDNLSGGERKVLQLFLKELSKILQGAIGGEEAIDPSDPPLYAKIILNKEEPEQDVPDEDEENEEDVKKVTGKEDTSPPIKVGGQQNLQEIRKKVRRLMKRI